MPRRQTLLRFRPCLRKQTLLRSPLRQNYPNPFNPVTEILYDLPADHLVELFVYDLLGREVIQLVNAPMTAGYHRVTWHAKDAHGQSVSAGIYFYQLRAGSFVRTQKMILLK